MMPRGYMATLKTTLVAEGSPRSPPLPKQTEQRGVTHTISFVTRSLVTKLPQRFPTEEASTEDAPPSLAASTTSSCSALGSDVEAAGDGDMLGARREIEFEFAHRRGGRGRGRDANLVRRFQFRERLLARDGAHAALQLGRSDETAAWSESIRTIRGITCNHMPSATIRGSHTQSHAITCHQRSSSHLSMRIGSILYCNGTGLLYCVSTAGTHSAGPKGG